jgi:SAM-dependent methyltransferase
MSGATEAVRTLVRGLATMGGRQNFLNRRWIAWLLKALPPSRREETALRLLALSPHYFFRDLELDYAGMPRREWLHREHARSIASRREIAERVLAPWLRPDGRVLDYGCGPGFLAHALAQHVREVVACDISRGTLACAEALNAAPNLRYLLLPRDPLPTGFDLVCSFAVVQHVTDSVFDSLLREWARVLRPGGQAVVHVVCHGAPGWRTEAEWRADRSLRGRMRWRYGLHCFARSPGQVTDAARRAGFADVRLVPVREVAPLALDPHISTQHLCLLTMPSTPSPALAAPTEEAARA